MRSEHRRQYSLTGKFVLTYCGSMGWNDPVSLVEYYSKFRNIKRNVHLLILTFERYNVLLGRTLTARKISSDLYTIMNPSVEEVPNLLPAGDVGLLLLKKLPTARKAVTIKFAEYLAAGLPVVVSSHVEGAAALVRNHKCGVVVDPENNCVQREKWLLENYSELQENGFRLANSYLALNSCSEKYLKIYET